MATLWNRSNYSVGLNERGMILLKAANADNEEQSVTMELSSELAAQIAEAMLEKVAYVEYTISQTVERMTKFE